MALGGPVRQIESRALHLLCWSAATACACSLGPFSISGRPNAAADIAAVGYSAATDAAARYQGTSSLIIATTAYFAGATETKVVAATAALR